MEFKVDFHVHSDASPDGRHSLTKLVRAAKKKGIDALAVTDHNVCTPVPAELDGVLLIPGCEVSTQSGHITALFLRKPLPKQLFSGASLPDASRTVEAIHLCGGFAVLAHPFQNPQRKKEELPRFADGIEAINARACLKHTAANRKASAFAAESGLSAIGGSDAHAGNEVGNAYTVVSCEELTLSALRRAVEAGKTLPVLAKETSHFSKGLSQFRLHRKKGLPGILTGTAYLLYCLLRDIPDCIRKRVSGSRPA